MIYNIRCFGAQRNHHAELYLPLAELLSRSRRLSNGFPRSWNGLRC